MENNTKQHKLLDEFAPPSYEEWMELIEVQLKGASFEKKLVTKTDEGIDIQPIYRKVDAKEVTFPGQFPYTRSTRASGPVAKNWEVSQRLTYSTVAEFNEAVKSDVSVGLTRIYLNLDQAGRKGLDPEQGAGTGKNGLSICSKEDIEVALKDIDISTLSFQIDAGPATLPLLGLLFSYYQAKGISFETIQGNTIFDPLAELALSGTLTQSLESLYDQMGCLIPWVIQNMPEVKTLFVDARPYCEGGGSAVQELGFALATAVEYLREMQNRGIGINEAASQVGFAFATGSDFFMEIAKLRALRTVWANVVEAFGGDNAAQKATIYSGSAQYNKTIHDPYVNMLRNTTEAFSGMIGGCDILSVEPFDDVFGRPDQLSRRIARNVQVILKDECHGGRVIDPAGGSWFIENLTTELGQKAWTLFQEVEKQGGMAAALKAGFVQNSIADVHKEKTKKLARRKNVAIGTNMYANLDEKLPEFYTPDYKKMAESRANELKSFKQKRNEVKELGELSSLVTALEKSAIEIVDKVITAAANGATISELYAALEKEGEIVTVPPITIQRGVEAYELLRQKAVDYKERTGERPKIFLANMGPLRQYKARADFTTGFLQPGGFLVVSNDGFETVEAAVDATIASKAAIVVMCSTDATYPDLVPAFTEAIKNKKPDMTVAIAGYPKENIESFKQMGVDDFIYLQADNLQLLQKFQQKVGA